MERGGGSRESRGTNSEGNAVVGGLYRLETGESCFVAPPLVETFARTQYLHSSTVDSSSSRGGSARRLRSRERR